MLICQDSLIPSAKMVFRTKTTWCLRCFLGMSEAWLSDIMPLAGDPDDYFHNFQGASKLDIP